MTEIKKHLDLNLDFLDDKKSADSSGESNPNNSNPVAKPTNVITSSSNVRPWVRFIARNIDMYVFGIILAIFWVIFLPFPMPKSNLVFGMLILFLWMFFEPLFLCSVGSTFGKWLLKIKLKDTKGNKLSLKTALYRSFHIWFAGYGIGFPIVSLFTLKSSWNDLTRTGSTGWDKDCNTSITHEKIGIIRWIFAVCLIAIFIALICAGAKN